MKIFQFIGILLLIGFIACEPVGSSQQQQTTEGQEGSNTSNPQTSALARAKTHQDSLDEKLIHDCKIPGEVLADNQIWLKEANTLVAIVADSTTYEEDYGDSHRVLEAYNTVTCELVKREVLPVNFSPDYPYYLANINYNNASQIIGIRGLNTVYVYNTKTQKIETVEPKYLTKRLADDAQSGSIQHLEVWENYMIGYAEDKGVFVIDINNQQAPASMTAFAEYKLPDESYSSLFMLTSEGDKQQAILPNYSIEDDSFAINPMFEQPKQMNTQISKGVRNNRYIILRETGDNPQAVVVDMLEQKEVNLPDDVKGSKAKDILDWLKKNDK